MCARMCVHTHTYSIVGYCIFTLCFIEYILYLKVFKIKVIYFHELGELSEHSDRVRFLAGAGMFPFASMSRPVFGQHILSGVYEGYFPWG